MIKFNKGISTPVGIIIILLTALLAGGLVVWYAIRQDEIEKTCCVPPPETANWKTYRNEGFGYEFKYPEKIGVSYIDFLPEGWWPEMIIGIDASETDFMCEENQNLKTESGYGKRERVRINGVIYCVTTTSEEIADSFLTYDYLTYNYLTIKNSRFVALKFILRYTHCDTLAGGIDNKIKECEKEQENFNPGVLAGKIISTLKFSKSQTNPIDVFMPKPNETVKSPIEIEGKVRGTWFFEGSFSIKLLDKNGNEIEIGRTVAHPQEGGMYDVNEFMNFRATLEFREPETETGTLVFEKDNPSAFPENDKGLRTPVIFGNYSIPIEAAGLKTYKNEEFEFEIENLKDFSFKRTENGVMIIFPDSYKNSSYIFKNDVLDAWVGVGIGIMGKEGFVADDQCQKFEKLDDEEVKINNLNFIKGSFTSRAMGGWYTDYNMYRILHNGSCYEIVLAVNGLGLGAGAHGGMGPLPQDSADPGSEKKFISILEQILSTFRFLK